MPPEPSERVRAILERVVEELGVEASVDVDEGAEEIVGRVEGEDVGLLIGLALDEKAAGGATGFVGVVLAALGGLWVPVEVFPETMRTIASGMPSYWYAEAGRDIAAGGAPSGSAVLVLAGFTAAFAVLAVLVARRPPLYAVAG